MVNPTRKSTGASKPYEKIISNENALNTIVTSEIKTNKKPDVIKSHSGASLQKNGNRLPLKPLPRPTKSKQNFSKYTSTNIEDPFECIWEIPRTPLALPCPKTSFNEYEISDADISVDYTMSRENSPRDPEPLDFPVMEIEEGITTPSLPQTSLVTIESEEKELPTTKKEEDLSNLLNHFVCLKYGRRGKPHQRELWLSEDHTEIQWKTPNKKEKERAILVREVTKLILGASTKVFGRFPNICKNKQDCCLSLLLNGKKSSLDLEFKTSKERDDFSKSFACLLNKLY